MPSEKRGASDARDNKPEVKNYITPDGFRRLQTEFEELRWKKRREVVIKLAEAAAEGDRSENAEYIYRKKQLREIDRRIRFLMKRMAAAEVIDASQHRSDRVCFGAVVVVEDDNGTRTRYHIVGEDESLPRQGKVSWSSPIGRGLIGKKVGDLVTLRLPTGERELSIEGIELSGGAETGSAAELQASISRARSEAQQALTDGTGDELTDDDDDDDGREPHGVSSMPRQ